MRRTKIVCTIGPSSSKQSDLERLVRGGMDVARLNFSHGTHEEHLAVLTKLRDISRKQDRAVAILQDLSGPKVRLGNFGAPLVLKKGQEVAFSLNAYDPIAYIPLLPSPSHFVTLTPIVPSSMSSLSPGLKAAISSGKGKGNSGI